MARFDANLAIPIVTVLFVVYGMAGGLGGAIITDFVQGIMTIIFSVMLLASRARSEVGGIASHAGDDRRGRLGCSEMLSLVAPGEIGVFLHCDAIDQHVVSDRRHAKRDGQLCRG